MEKQKIMQRFDRIILTATLLVVTLLIASSCANNKEIKPNPLGTVIKVILKK